MAPSRERVMGGGVLFSAQTETGSLLIAEEHIKHLFHDTTNCWCGFEPAQLLCNYIKREKDEERERDSFFRQTLKLAFTCSKYTVM